MTKRLSIIIPVYNEAPNLVKLIPQLFATPCPIDRQWIVVDDGSTDDSYEILEKLQKNHDFELMKQVKNMGKGAAIVAGLTKVDGDFVIIQDADFETDPGDIPALLQPLLDEQADVVYGSRFKKNNPQIRRTYHYLGNRVLTIISNLLSGIYLTDMETCYKAIRADLIKCMNLKSKRFGFEIEVTAYIAKTKARVYELPINYHPRNTQLGKKIGWPDGVAALFHLLRFNLLTAKNRMFTDLPQHYQ